MKKTEIIHEALEILSPSLIAGAKVLGQHEPGKIQTKAYRKRTFWEWFRRVHPLDTLPDSGGAFQFTGVVKPERAGHRYVYDLNGKEFQQVE